MEDIGSCLELAEREWHSPGSPCPAYASRFERGAGDRHGKLDGAGEYTTESIRGISDAYRTRIDQQEK